MKQATLARPVTFTGIGLHSGHIVTLTLHPADSDSGLFFVRTDRPDSAPLPVHVANTQAGPMTLCTTLVGEDGISVGTVEHVLSALRGAGITNARMTIDGPEVPILDGSARPFFDAFVECGIILQNRDQPVLTIMAPVRIDDGDKWVELVPDACARFDVTIDFDEPAIGRQSYGLELTNGYYEHDIASARTFGFADQVAQLRAMGLARGGSLDNAVVFQDNRVLNPEGLRFADECVRHKVLDAIGDLTLAGYPIRGAYRAFKPSHELNRQLVQALLNNPAAYRLDGCGLAALPTP